MGGMIVKKMRGTNWITKVSLVPAFTLLISIFMCQGWNSPPSTEAAPAANGRLVFSNSTTTPQTRTSTTTSPGSFSAASATIAGAGQTFIVDRAAPTRNEHLVGYLTTGGVLYIYRWNGSTWTNETSAAGGWGGTVTVGGDGVNGRRFDIAYEKTTGKAMVVYSTNVTTSGGNKLAYRTWDGTTWSAATNITTARSSQVAAMTWVKLKSKPLAGSNEIALVACDTGTTAGNNALMTALIWNGTSWTEAGSAFNNSTYGYIPNSTGPLVQNDLINLAYESVSGDLLVVYTTTDDQYYRTYSGGTWGTPTSYGSSRTAPLQMVAESDPQSNQILVMWNRSSSANVYANVWTGTATGTTTTVVSTGVTPAINKKTISGKWLVVGGTSYAMAMSDTTTAGTIGYGRFTGGTWTTDQTYVSGIGAAANWMDSNVDPQGADTMMLTMSTGAAGTGSLWAKRLVLSAGPTFTWTNADGGSALSTALASATSQNFSFAYNLYIPNTTTAGTATAAVATTTSIAVSMPYTDDGNANNTYTVDYKLSSAGSWTNLVTAAAHTASPYTTTITGLTPSTSYDVRVTYNDADGVTGTNPQTITGVTTPLWTKVYDSSTSPGTPSYTAPAGANRLMVVALTSEHSSSVTGTMSATFGGTSMTKQVSDDSISLGQHTALFYLKDAQIPSGAQTLNISMNGGSLLNLTAYVAIFYGVDQSAPITNSRNYNSGSTAVSSAAFSPALTVNAGDQAVYVSNIYNTSGTTIPSYTLPLSWTSGANGTGTGSSTAWKTELCKRTIPGTDTTDTANITSISPSSRVSMSGMSIKAAPVCVRSNPTVIISAPATKNIYQGSPVNYTVSVTNNDTAICAATTFNLSKTDTPAVPNANFSASLPAAIGPINSGATMTVTLTHTATAGASIGSTEQTSVTAADANHAAVTTPEPAFSTVVEQNAKIVYSIGTITPQYRDYAGSSNSFSAQTATIAGAGQTFMIDRACQFRDEHIAGYVTTTGVLYILRRDKTGAWSNEWNVTIPSYNGVTGRRFDIAYKNSGGGAMVVYSNNTNGQFAYRTWDGASWSLETTVTMSRLTNVIVSLRLAAKPAVAGIGFAVAALDSGGRLSAMTYIPSTGWGNEHTSALSTSVYNSASSGDVPAFDLAYEGATGNLLVVNSVGDNYITYWRFTGTWSGPSTLSINNTGAKSGAIFAATDTNAGSNNILVGGTDTVGNNRIFARIWDGTSFSSDNNSYTMGYDLSANRMPLRGGFVTSGGTTAAVIVYNDGTAGQLGYFYTTNGGTSWTATTTTAVTIGNGNKAWIDVKVSPKITDTLIVTLSDNNSDLWAKRLVFTEPNTFTWTNADGGTALTTSLATVSAQNFSFAYDRFINSTVLGDEIQGTSATVCPADANQKIDGFSFNTMEGTDSVTALTVTTTNQAAIAGMEIWNEAGTTQYFGTVNNPVSDTWNFSGGTPIPVTTEVSNYKILVTFKAYGAAPAGDTPTTAYVTTYTCTKIKAGADTADTTLMLTNSTIPAAAWGMNIGGAGTATLNWTPGAEGDSVMIARYTTNTDSAMPAYGTAYAAGSSYGAGGTVVYAGSAGSFMDTLTPGTYYYRIFEYSGCLKYAATAPWTEPIPVISANQTIAGTATAAGESATSIKVTMPYTYDANANNTYTVDYKLSSSETWTSWAPNASHSANPYATTITGLTDKQTYDVRCTYNDPEGVAGANPQIISGITLTNNLVHNSIITGSTKWANGWGISGGKYGEFVCGTCHIPRATNIKGVISPVLAPTDSFPGSTVNFQATTTPGGFGDDTTIHATSQKICEVCHSLTTYHKYNQSAIAGHESCVAIYDCTSCHPHNKGFKAVGGCTVCHSLPVGSRVAVVGQFSGNSHHIQGPAVTDQQCYQCHWEANSDGSVNTTYHGGCVSPGSVVDLVIYGNKARPATFSEATAVQYTANGSRAEIQKINQHCLACHSAQNSTTQPFGDGKSPYQYAWDGLSIADRYSQTGTTTWGKYTTVTNASKRNIMKSYSAHGNAPNNYGGGWVTTATGTGIDGALTPTRGGAGAVNIACFDCHNSHGSTVSGTTTSYTSATTNGGILKDTAAGKGGYTMAYTPQAGGSTANKNAYNPGAAICFDCHMTASSGTKPWGYQGTFGATQPIMGYDDTQYFGPGTFGPQLTYTYKAAAATAHKGGHLGVSSALSSTPAGAINGLCTPCHDPHGVSPALSQQYAVPLLKGTWMTSPYKQDFAPLAKNEKRGGGKDENYFSDASTPGYHIDQNTFSGDTTTSQPAGGTALKWNWSSTARVTQTVDAFGGLCLKCHPKSGISPTTGGAWKSMDRIHNTVKGWGGSGANASNAIHSFTCSKCHAPHNSGLNRLMVTNCLDFTHRGRVASGGSPPIPIHSINGKEGQGKGQFPGGGGGKSNKSTDKALYPGPWFFGTTSSPYIRECHGTTGAGGTTYPSNQLWNLKTPW